MSAEARRGAEVLVTAWKQRVFPGALIEPPDQWLIEMVADAVAQAVKEARIHDMYTSRDEQARAVAEAASAQAVKERDAQWADYVDWLNGHSATDAQLAALHGFGASAEVVEEGKRRRAALGYVPKGEPDGR